MATNRGQYWSKNHLGEVPNYVRLLRKSTRLWGSHGSCPVSVSKVMASADVVEAGDWTEDVIH